MTLRSARLSRRAAEAAEATKKKDPEKGEDSTGKEVPKKEEEKEKEAKEGEDETGNLVRHIRHWSIVHARCVDAVSEPADVSGEEGGIEAPRTVAAGDKVMPEKEELAAAAMEEVKEAERGSDGEEGGESDDPDRLWCICHQPHDDRLDCLREGMGLQWDLRIKDQTWLPSLSETKMHRKASFAQRECPLLKVFIIVSPWPPLQVHDLL